MNRREVVEPTFCWLRMTKGREMKRFVIMILLTKAENGSKELPKNTHIA
jgi:hypothetical protein